MAGIPDGLFTTSEMLMMSAKLETLRMKRTSLQAATQALCAIVRKQLHVVILWNTDCMASSLIAGRSLHKREKCRLSQEGFRMRYLFQALYRSCDYVDNYKPWGRRDYNDIAIMWWQKGNLAI